MVDTKVNRIKNTFYDTGFDQLFKPYIRLTGNVSCADSVASDQRRPHMANDFCGRINVFVLNEFSNRESFSNVFVVDVCIPLVSYPNFQYHDLDFVTLRELV